MKDIIDEFLWRGLIKDKVNGIRNLLNKNYTKIYVGFDPTADSLHIGNLLPIIMLLHFQKNGHYPMILIGGATGLIGDPSEKWKKRNVLDKKNIEKNIIFIKNQIKNLLIYHKSKMKFFNNINWIKNISSIKLICEIGNFFTIKYLMGKNSVKNRMKNKEDGISFSEFSYSIFQAYDFYYLNKKQNCKIQIGGSDQWGNITSGIDLIKKKTGKKVYAITFPLITNKNGKKFGKSEKEENIWLDKKKTTPYKFYQFLINLSDNEVEKLIKLYTFYKKEKINELIKEHKKNPKERKLQKILATYLTKWIHGHEVYKKIHNIISILFNKETKIKFLKENDVHEIYSNIPNFILSNKILKKGITLIDLLILSKLFTSKKKANHAIIKKSIFINKIIVLKNRIINKNDIIGKRYILLQFGKKNFLMIKIKN